MFYIQVGTVENELLKDEFKIAIFGPFNSQRDAEKYLQDSGWERGLQVDLQWNLDRDSRRVAHAFVTSDPEIFDSGEAREVSDLPHAIKEI